jgi:uncharacterized zinc-type alcohol dehydrogenase-like protein
MDLPFFPGAFPVSTIALAATEPKGSRGQCRVVGAVLEPLEIAAFPLMVGQKTVSGSPLGSPATTADMLEFCARHDIKAVCETFPMSKANEAIDRLRSCKARYRVVLTQDL